jgi:hypothetical protein
MNRTLEGRYRRLLAIYPAEHRRQHQDEMLGVLMTGAAAGQRWPGRKDAADLIWGALLIRLHPHHDDARKGWADALAVTSIVVPVLLLAYSSSLFLARQAITTSGSADFAGSLLSFAVGTGPWLILTTLVLLRLRRVAGVAAAGMLVYLAVVVYGTAGWSSAVPQSMDMAAALALEALALLASPGPRRGLQLMTGKRWALAVMTPAAAGVGSVSYALWRGHPAVWEAVTIAAISVILTGMMLGSPLNRRLGCLLSVLAYYAIVGWLVPPLAYTGPGWTAAVWGGPLRIMLSFLPFAVILGVLLARALRSIRRAAAGGREA